jgi:hypothetical protein
MEYHTFVVATRKGKNSISLCLDGFQFRLSARIVLDVRSIPLQRSDKENIIFPTKKLD